MREPKSAAEIASLINESLRALPDLRDVAIVIIRRSEPDAHGCNWFARHEGIRLNALPASLQLVEDIVRNARHYFNLFDVH